MLTAAAHNEPRQHHCNPYILATGFQLWSHSSSGFSARPIRWWGHCYYGDDCVVKSYLYCIIIMDIYKLNAALEHSWRSVMVFDWMRPRIYWPWMFVLSLVYFLYFDCCCWWLGCFFLWWGDAIRLDWFGILILFLFPIGGNLI